MSRTLSFKTKLKLNHSEHCLIKKQMFETKKNVAEHRFEYLKEEMLMKESFERGLNRFKQIYKDVLKDYNTVMESGCPKKLYDMVWDNSLTGGLDFSVSKKMKMYEELLEEIRGKLRLYKEFTDFLDCNILDEMFMTGSMEVMKCHKNLLGYDEVDGKGKIHIDCKCPNVVMSCGGEECEICYENGIRLFDIQCGNKHMLCYQCLLKLFEENSSCPFCREKIGLNASSIVQIEKFSKEVSVSTCG